ncbi:MAG: ATPase, T2SS/T4P/T4SS family, partial [Ilumatobacteraceae bacterium]
MALFQKTKETSDASLPLPRPQAAVVVPGEAAAECMRVGQVLVESEQLSAENLASALAGANGDLLQFADIVLGRFAVDRGEVAKAIAMVTEVALLDSKSIELPDNAKDFLDEKIVRAHCVIGIAEEGGAIVVIAADPSPARRRLVEAAAGRPVRWTVADPATIRTFIDRTYRANDEIEKLVRVFEVGDDQSRVAAAAAEVSLDDQAPIIQLVSRIVSQAMRDRTSDIHVEPLDDKLRIRFRIDGHLVEAFSLPISVHPALSSRLKIMSGMNIVEKRKPQDGQFSTVIDGKEVDVRVASVATVFGEKIVMRILDKSRSMIGL